VGKHRGAARRGKKMGSPDRTQGISPAKEVEPDALSDWDESSRGGTRTLEPGIMRNGASPLPFPKSLV